MSGSLSSHPAEKAEAVTPSDTANLTRPARGIWVGSVAGGADVKVLLLDEITALTFKGCAAGTVIPIQCIRVYSTGTTATELIALS